MKKLRVVGALASIILLLNGCRQESKTITEIQPEAAKPEIATGTLDEVGIDTEIITGLLDSIREGFYPNRHSLLIYKDDKLVVEEYFKGADQNWGDDIGVVVFNDTVLHDMRSVSKSVVSACIGLAIAQGKIKGVDQPVFDFFEDYGQYKNEGREKLTLKHLLTMTSGLEWDETIPYTDPKNSEIQMINSGDGIGFVLSRNLTAEPGTEWKYNGGTTELLAEIIRRVSGKDIHEFAKEALFEPLDIHHTEWTISPATNTPAAASGLRLTPRDMLKFAILYHQKGKWGIDQLLPKEWVEESLSSHIDRPNSGGYGYQFWVLDINTPNGHLTVPAAFGNGDQRIYFENTNNLLVITTAGNYNRWDIEKNSFAMLERIYKASGLLD
ncbi:serine hydrolase domain-containing protein [Aegicerativicinus sediminis]|uniref:serine hydrolase domain-containing protein n=1 Tax=Aegicerativicinus sediminis TaxID=2893202 RepID=UPI001E5AB32B|nr:serine hydrolase [Aegicerativicinus sediminis]